MNSHAREQPAACKNRFSVGGVDVEISGERAADVVLASPLARFQSEGETFDLRIEVEWVESLGKKQGRRLFDSGAVWQMYEAEEGFAFDFNAPTLGSLPYKTLFVDKFFHRANLRMSEASFADQVASPLEYPLDELLIMHRLTQEKAIELHGCGIVSRDGIGNLFVGHSGAGKSTTTRFWTAQEDVEVLSDDRIIVRRDDPGAVSSQGNSHSAQNHKWNMRMYGTPWHGEAMYASPGSAPLARIFVLEHGYGNVLTRLSPSQAVAELFARSFVPFHRHEYVDSALEFLQEVVDVVPVYRFAFEPDPRAVDTILKFHD
jgi:hypothetical protein